MSEPKILIDCRDAALGYEGRPIWEHLSFRVRRGIIFASWGTTAPASPPC